MEKSIRHFAAAVILLLLAAVTAYLTSTPYGNAFFSNANGLVLSFLAFFAVNAGWWATMIDHHGAEAPLGYYIFSRKGADGSFGSYGTGSAVVYLPSNGKG